MLRLDRSTLPQIPRPVYELTLNRTGAEAITAVMVGDSPHPCKWTAIPTNDAEAFATSLSHWLMSLPYFDAGDPDWADTVRAVVQRFTDHVFGRQAPIAGDRDLEPSD